jgi:hypothetical protein
MKVYVNFESKFSQHLYPWSSLDVQLLKKYLELNEIEVEFVKLDDIVERGINYFSNQTVIFGGSQNKIEKSVIEDYAYWLEKEGCNVVPSYEALRALENKGFQALASDAVLGDRKLDYYYNVGRNIRKLDGFVYKLTDGAGSNGVFMVPSFEYLKRKLTIESFKDSSIKSIIPYIKQLIKKVIRWRYIEEKKFYYKPDVKIVLQEFVEGLDCDYKVLVFGSKYFVLKRNILKGDFRASGSNLFDVISEAPEEVLEFAQSVYQKLKVPYCSLDIALNSSGKAYLIEYQCTHFGPYTYLSSTNFHENIDNCWRSVPWTPVCLEKAYADAIKEYLVREIS